MPLLHAMEPVTGDNSRCLRGRPLGAASRGVTVVAERTGAQTLDARILEIIGRWHTTGALPSAGAVDSLALDIFAYQFEHNVPYARYCRSLGIGPDAMPAHWRDVPPVPVTAFKDATLTTFPLQDAELCFETSGTTLGRSGRHYLQTAALYRAALLAGFDRAMLADGAKLRYFNVLPTWSEKPRSSLSYMMQTVTEARGDGGDGWYVQNEVLDIDAFIRDVSSAIADSVSLCIAGTAFGLVALLEALDRRGQRFALPPQSRIMETGGFKGRANEIARDRFYDWLSDRFSLDRRSIVAEYGMTELTSQYYDSHNSRAESEGIKVGPPWTRWRVVDSGGRDVPLGTPGRLVHLDLVNRSSVVAIATDDIAFARGDGFVLCGRSSDAEARGCSLEAEALWSSSR